jgi:predicted MFS family arabinose efflux permease
MTQSVFKRSTLLVMATATGMTVANLYYNQPLLDQIKSTFAVSFEQLGWIPTLTQMGYALGMLFLVPLGDKLERKKLVLGFTFLSAICMTALATAPSFLIVIIASCVLGLSTMTPQLLIPFAAQLATPDQRGKVIGTMMSGLLLGILLARTVSGFIGASYGWRAMFACAAVFLFALVALLALTLPKSTPSYTGSYGSLLKSVIDIYRTQPVLREASLYGAMLFGSFSVFWSTLIHLMETPAFNLGARSVGLFGLLGAAAAGVTPLIGSYADKKDARKVTGAMILLTLFSFLVFGISATSLIGIGVGVLLMDVGVQSGHVSNQSRILGLLPNAQSRLQTAYMFFYFLGGAAGSFLGNWAWGHYGWTGVCGAASALLIIAYIRYLLPVRGAPTVSAQVR